MSERAVGGGGGGPSHPQRDLMSAIELKSITLDLKDQPLRYNQMDDKNENCNSERKSLRLHEINPFAERDIDSSTSPKGEEIINCTDYLSSHIKFSYSFSATSCCRHIKRAQVSLAPEKSV